MANESVTQELIAALKGYRADHESNLGCTAFEQDSIGDNAIVESVDLRCEECRLADLAIAKAEGR